MSQRRCHLLLLCCAVPLLLARSAPSPPPSPSLDAAARERASTALRYAVDIGDEAKVEAAIQAGANVNDLGSNQQPPLVMASLAGHAGIIKLLLAAGADTTIGEGSGYTPLHAAAYQGQAEAVKVLLESGVKPEFHSDGYHPLHRACWEPGQKFADTIQVFLDYGVPYDLEMRPRDPLPEGQGLIPPPRTPLEMAEHVAQDDSSMEPSMIVLRAARAKHRAAQEEALKASRRASVKASRAKAGARGAPGAGHDAAEL